MLSFNLVSIGHSILQKRSGKTRLTFHSARDNNFQQPLLRFQITWELKLANRVFLTCQIIRFIFSTCLLFCFYRFSPSANGFGILRQLHAPTIDCKMMTTFVETRLPVRFELKENDNFPCNNWFHLVNLRIFWNVQKKKNIPLAKRDFLSVWTLRWGVSMIYVCFFFLHSY